MLKSALKDTDSINEYSTLIHKLKPSSFDMLTLSE